MSTANIGIKIFGDVKELIAGLKSGEKSVNDFQKTTAGSVKEIRAQLNALAAATQDAALKYGATSQEALRLKAAHDQVKGSLNEVLSITKKHNGILGELKSSLLGVSAGFLGVAGMAAGVASFFKGAVEGAMEDEKAERKLQFALGGSTAALDRMLSFKEKMMSETLFSEDEIMDVINMGLGMGRTEEQTKKLVETVMGVSRVTGMDLHGAMIAVTGTMEGVTGRLGRLAGDLKGLTEDQLKNGVAVDVLHDKYAKFASSGIDTAAGHVTQFKKAWEEFGDSVGSKVLPVLTNLLDGINDLTGGAKQSKKEQEDLLKLQEKYLKEHASDKGAKGDAGIKYAQIEGKVAEARAANLRASVEQLKVNNALAIQNINAWRVDTSHDAEIIKGIEDKISKTKELTDAESYRYEQLLKLIKAEHDGTLVGPVMPGTLGEAHTGNVIDKVKPIGAAAVNIPGMARGLTGTAGTSVTEINKLRDAIEGVSSTLNQMGSQFSGLFDSLGNAFLKFKEGFTGGWKEMASTIGSVVSSAVQVVSQLFSQQTDTRLKQLDETYNAERERIESSTMNEKSKAKALDKLDKDNAKQKRALMRQQAKDQKEAAIMQAIITGALGVIQATNAAPPLDIILPILIGAMVAAQIATIISQPLPALAKGGLAYAPTIAMVGDNPGAYNDPEVISPLSKLKQYITGNESQQELVARVHGNDLYFIMQRVNKLQNRIG